MARYRHAHNFVHADSRHTNSCGKQPQPHRHLAGRVYGLCVQWSRHDHHAHKLVYAHGRHSFFCGKQPQGIAFKPDGTMAYVCNYISSGTVTPITVATQTAGTAISVGTSPWDIAVIPDQAPISLFTASINGLTVSVDGSGSITLGSIAQYAWNFGDGHTTTTVTPTTSHTYASSGMYSISLTVTNSSGTSMSQVFTGQTVSKNGNPLAKTSKAVVLGSLPESAFITQGYTVGNASYGSVYQLSVPSDTNAGPITDNGLPVDVAFTPDHTKALVVNSHTNTVTILDLTQTTIGPGTTVAVGTGPSSVAITPNGARALVTNKTAGTVTVIDLPGGTVETTLTVGSSPYAVAITPDGTEAFVSNYGSNTISILSISTSVTVAGTTVCLWHQPRRHRHHARWNQGACLPLWQRPGERLHDWDALSYLQHLRSGPDQPNEHRHQLHRNACHRHEHRHRLCQPHQLEHAWRNQRQRRDGDQWRRHHARWRTGVHNADHRHDERLHGHSHLDDVCSFGDVSLPAHRRHRDRSGPGANRLLYVISRFRHDGLF